MWMTLAAVRSGKAEDKYRYSGTHTPNEKAIGTWIWVLWPKPKSPEDIDPKIKRYLEKRYKQRVPKNPKNILKLLEGGKVKGSGSFWSGNWLINPKLGKARKLIFRTVDGIDFMLVESGEFSKAAESEDWHPGFSGYARRSDLESPKSGTPTKSPK